ncbi:MAG: hypothetical protein ABI960_09490, partial [Candidatus Eisenbacteria bacterium]
MARTPSTLPRLLGYLRPYSSRLAGAIICMALYAAASGLTLGLLSPFIQLLSAPAKTNVGALAPAAAGGPAA